MATTPVPYSAGYQVFGPSPRVQRFAVSLHVNVSIKDIVVGNHTTLTGASNSPAGYLYEGSVMFLSTDGYWYWIGVTLPSGNPSYLTGVSGSNPTRQLAVLIDSYDTNANNTGNPVNAQAYFTGAFVLPWLQVASGVSGGVTGGTLVAELRANGILIEGETAVTTQTYGNVLPLSAAPV
jgi:hypothetical protein